jgi:hypothetical protein|tara:strand:+ start:811 stop:984 length:174 start_codon:yes stop_codon:yes gene_type:complete
MSLRLKFNEGTEVQQDIVRLLTARYEVDQMGAATKMQAILRRKQAQREVAAQREAAA